MRRRKEKMKRKRGAEWQREMKWKDPTSRITPITGTFRSQFLLKALAAIPQSLSLFLWLAVLCSLSLLFFFFFSFFHFIL